MPGQSGGTEMQMSRGLVDKRPNPPFGPTLDEERGETLELRRPSACALAKAYHAVA